MRTLAFRPSSYHFSAFVLSLDAGQRTFQTANKRAERDGSHLTRGAGCGIKSGSPFALSVYLSDTLMQILHRQNRRICRIATQLLFSRPVVFNDSHDACGQVSGVLTHSTLVQFGLALLPVQTCSHSSTFFIIPFSIPLSVLTSASRPPWGKRCAVPFNAVVLSMTDGGY